MFSSHSRMLGSVLVVIVMLLGQNVTIALTPGEAVDALAGRLDQTQIKDGPDTGSWPLETLFMGPMVTGLASAYEWTGDPNYQAAADLAGDQIMAFSIAQGNLLGDEAYAFMQLSEISDDPTHNMWQNALVDFFLSPRRNHNEATTDEYLRAFDGLEPSTAVFYLAHYLVAADYVDDQDTDVYRRALISHLSYVDDDSSFPVMALGVATWALVTTDTPADRPITSYEIRPYEPWAGITVGDLPAMLASHQVPEGESFAGAFYWRFDHTDGGTGGVVAGYTEDAIFATLGLIAVASKSVDGGSEEADQAVAAAQTVLLDGIDEDGQVYEHLSRQGGTYNTFSGEMLEVLWSIEQYLGREVPADAEPEVAVESE